MMQILGMQPSQSPEETLVERIEGVMQSIIQSRCEAQASIDYVSRRGNKSVGVEKMIEDTLSAEERAELELVLRQFQNAAGECIRQQLVALETRISADTAALAVVDSMMEIVQRKIAESKKVHKISRKRSKPLFDVD